MRLLVERVRDVQPDFRLTPANGPTVAAICRRLDALPLALELAAPWIKVLTVEDLLRRLTHDVLLSAAGPRDLPQRQQTMNATVAWSYQLVSADEQRVFRRLGALPGRFSIDAAAVVLAGRDDGSARSDQVLSALADLIDKVSFYDPDLSRGSSHTRSTGARDAGARLMPGERRRLEALARYCTGGLACGRGVGRTGAGRMADRVRDDPRTTAALRWLIERGRSPRRPTRPRPEVLG